MRDGNIRELHRCAVRFLAAILILACSRQIASAQTQQGNAQAAGQFGRSRAGIIILPIDNNTDFGGGRGSGLQSQTIFNPVVAFQVSKDWGFVSNTQLSFTYSAHILPRTATGLGDIVQNTWIAPVPKSEDPRSTWGFGTVLQAPTAAPNILGQRQWGFGPSAFVSVQAKPITLGVVINHPWRIAGERRNVPSLDRLYMFPFINFALPKNFTLSVNGDVARNDKTGIWAAPVTVSVSHPVTLGDQEFVLNCGVRSFAGNNADKASVGVQVGLTYTLSRSGSRP